MRGLLKQMDVPTKSRNFLTGVRKCVSEGIAGIWQRKRCSTKVHFLVCNIHQACGRASGFNIKQSSLKAFMVVTSPPLRRIVTRVGCVPSEVPWDVGRRDPAAALELGKGPFVRGRKKLLFNEPGHLLSVQLGSWQQDGGLWAFLFFV